MGKIVTQPDSEAGPISNLQAMWYMSSVTFAIRSENEMRLETEERGAALRPTLSVLYHHDGLERQKRDIRWLTQER
jgi:hypothetical protein